MHQGGNMTTFTREEIIQAIIEHEEMSYDGSEDMPKPVTKKKLLKLSNDDLVEYYEYLTTNHGLYRVENA